MAKLQPSHRDCYGSLLVHGPYSVLVFYSILVFSYIFRHIHSSRKDIGQGGPLLMDFVGSMVFPN